MTIQLTYTTFITSSNTVTLAEGVYQIQLKTGQTINTNNFATGGTYVFKKRTRILFCYLIARRTAGSSSTFNVDVTTGTLNNQSSGSVEIYLPPYFTQLAKAISNFGLSPTYYISACVSSLSPTASAGTTEKNYYANNKSFNKSAYSNSNRAPNLRVNAEKVPNSNSYVKASLSGNNLQFTVTQSNYSFISVVIQL